MTFISLQFALFITAAAALYYLLPQRFRALELLAASLVFYWLVCPQCVVWLLAAAATAYLAALGSAAAKSARARRVWAAGGVVLLLGSLLYFKYSGFLLGAVFGAGSDAAAAVSSLIVPVGISFYTLQAAGYVIDVERGVAPPERDPVVFAAYITFFPHIMSGPIARSTRLLPQFRSEHRFSGGSIVSGARRFLLGVFKKAAVAEVAALFVDAVYFDLTRENGASVAAAALMYSIQLYFDFSGYTDMALGAGRIFGFELEENFDAPYFSRSVSEIWSRWHISLSSWLREYVYFPLGGSRRGFARKLLNIAVVFLVSGLWHGAGWGFLVWGGIFALARVLEELARRFIRVNPPRSVAVRILRSVFSRIYVFAVWSFAFIFFRLPDLALSGRAVSMIFDLRSWSLSALAERVYNLMMNTVASSPPFAKLVTACAAALALLLLALEYVFVYRRRSRTDRPNDLLGCLPEWPRFALGLAMLLAALVYGVFGGSSFVYFQF